VASAHLAAHNERVEDLVGVMIDSAFLDWALQSSGGGAVIDRNGAGAPHRTPPWLPSVRIESADLDVERSPRKPPVDVAVSKVWGHLRLLDHVGHGGFGHVYRAWDSRLERELALKLLPAMECRPTGVMLSALDEGRLLARVRHPNVVTIYGAERIDDTVGLWMEFVRGKTLEELLAQGVTFSDAETTAICLDLCGAVSAVHDSGLLHADIKAHNVMRADDGRIVLMDFGAGRKLEDESFPAGTPLYLAPEVLRGDPVTVRSDIYSLGVLLFHLVTDAYPVMGESVQDLCAAHNRGRRVSLETKRPDLHPSLKRVIERATDPVPERRYPNADAMAADLRVGNVDAFTADLRVLTRRPGLGTLSVETTAA
jgi:eukaryotic-like serine/threonine-protein kinase